ncbi:MAG: amino acid adenylation domain-containing protein [Gammaproteobacteria bacterium]|nr:amino acid adenylation domain-containing protein [Gammaproteobacteria bacterium]
MDFGAAQTIISVLDLHSKARPERTAFTLLYRGCEERGSLSYAELQTKARQLAAHLQQEINPRQTAMLVYPAGLDFICAIFACFMAGIIAVPVPVPRSSRSTGRLAAVAGNTDSAFILTDSQTLQRIDSKLAEYSELDSLRVLATDTLLAGDVHHGDLPVIDPEDIAFLQYTSGSTHLPKGVMVSHRNLMHNMVMLKEALNTTEDSVVVTWLPMFHDMGLIGKIMQPVYAGAHCVVMTPEAFIQKPVRWLQAISKYRANISVAPNFAYALCVEKVSEEDKSALDLSSWKTAGNGAEPVRAHDIVSFAEKFSTCGFTRAALFPCFGLAEATLFVSGVPEGVEPRILYVNKTALQDNRLSFQDKSDKSTQSVVSCGRSFGEQTLAIVDPVSKQQLNEDMIGEIWVAGGHIPDGYWRQDALSLEIFHARDNKDNGPFMRTGDLGFINKGELFVTGRIKDLIIIHGRNFYPQDVESVVQDTDDPLRKDCGVAFSAVIDDREKLVIVQEIDKRTLEQDSAKKILDGICVRITEEFEVVPYDVVLLARGTMPKTSSGKLQRSLVKARYLDDEFSPPASLRNINGEHHHHALLSNVEKVLQHDSAGDIAKLIPVLAQQGLFGMQIDRRLGGLALSCRELVRVFSKLAARDLALAMYLGIHHAGTYSIRQFAKASISQSILKELAAGEALVSFALTEAAAGSNPAAMTGRAICSGSGWNLSGEKIFVGLGQKAKYVVTFLKSTDIEGNQQGISALLVPTETLHEKITAISSMGMPLLAQANIRFDHVVLDEQYLLGEPGQGMAIAHETLQYNRLGVAAMCTGAMQSCLSAMKIYAEQRHIATGLLADNPLTRQKLQELHCAWYATDKLVAMLASARDQQHAVPDMFYPAAKNLGAEYLWYAADLNMQLSGCRGYLAQSNAAKLLTDARAFRIIEGPTETLNYFNGLQILRGPDALLSFYPHSPAAQETLAQFIHYAEDLNRNIPTDAAPDKIRDRQLQLASHIGELANYYLALSNLIADPPATDDSVYTDTLKWLRGKIQLIQEMFRLTLPDERQTATLREPVIAGAVRPDPAVNRHGLKHRLEGVAPVTQDKAGILRSIITWMSEALQYPAEEIDPARPFVVYGLESVMSIELGYYLEQTFNQKITAEVIWAHSTPDKLAEFLAGKLNRLETNISISATDPDHVSETLSVQQEWQDVKRAEMEFSLFYFSSNPAEYTRDKYYLLTEGSRFADQHGFKAVWIPERHFHSFGGIYPNPSVLASALAMITEQVRIRAGSVVVPLHHPIRVAEEWAMSDNLSNGRIDIGFAAGWNANDFALSPENYANRVQVMYDSIDTIQQLWRGQSIAVANGKQEKVRLRLYPMPVQKELPIWITCSGGRERFIEAGAIGANVITALLFQTAEELQEKIQLYRAARARHGFDPMAGKVTLMLHTFVGDTLERVRETVREPFTEYLETSIDLWRQEAGKLAELDAAERQQVLDFAFERYFQSAALFGTPLSLVDRVREFHHIGVDELACLIDFGVDNATVLQSLHGIESLMHKVRRTDTPTATVVGLHAKTDRSQPFQQAPMPGYRLSDGQQALWFIYKTAPDSHAYDVSVACELDTLPDVALLQKALNKVIQRHPVLSSGLEIRGEAVCQVPGKYPTCAIAVRVVDPDAWEQFPDQLLPQHYPPFKLEAGPLFRAWLFTDHIQRAVLLLRAHHTVTDFWSSGVITRELQLYYTAFGQRRDPDLDYPLTFYDYVTQQQQLLGSPQGESLWQYWQDKLQDAVTTLELPYDFSPTGKPAVQGGVVEVELGALQTAALNTLAESANTTLFTLMLSVYSVLLTRYTGQTDFLIGAPALGRDDARYWKTVGYFANTLVMRPALVNNPSFRQFLSLMDDEVKSGTLHQNLPFACLVERLRPTQRRGGSPLLQVLFDLIAPERFAGMIQRALPVPESLTVTALKPGLKHILIPQQEGQFELSLEIMELTGKLVCHFKYRRDLFRQETVQRMAANMQRLITNILSDPDKPVQHLDLIHPQEMALIKQAYWKTPQALPRFPLHVLVEQQIDRFPDRIAVRHRDVNLTYAELEQQSNQVAAFLLANGVKGGSLAAIHMARSHHLVIGLLGILKAGCAYLPLDQSYPVARIVDILQDANPAVLLTQCDSSLAADTPCRVCLIEEILNDPAMTAQRPGLPVQLQDTAYVIYTSGSTGKPKGVILTHDNAGHFLAHMLSWFDLDEHDRWTLFHSVAFDFSVWEIWGALASGACVVMVAPDETHDIRAFHRLVQEEKITILNLTPAVFRQYMDIDLNQASTNTTLRKIFLGGEKSEPRLYLPWFERYGDSRPMVLNMYGITETTVFSTVRQLVRQDCCSTASPIGAVFDDSPVYLLDPAGQPVPIGVTGEIYIGGDGVAQGYLNRAELTQERFINNHLQPDTGKLYKTGDLARINQRGELEYLHRSDHQVKIRGYRIELHEIESVLEKHPAIKNALIWPRQVNDTGKQLVAYYLLRADNPTPTEDELKAWLKQSLPLYMVPAFFVLLEAIPVNKNGKTDYAALPDPAMPSTTDARLPHTHAEEQVAAIWGNVLGFPVQDTAINFFEAGGDSLSLVRLAMLFEHRLAWRVDVEALLMNLNIREQARLLEKQLTAVQVNAPDGHPGRGRRRWWKDIILPPVAAFVFWLIQRVIMLTVTTIEVNKPVLPETQPGKTSPMLLAFWHGEGVMLIKPWHKRDVTLLASNSRDGLLMARILARFGFKLVYGSQSTRGSAGLQELIRCVQAGSSAGMAVDGSRGPYHSVKPGIVELSRQTQLPIHVAACVCSNNRVLEKSWDKAHLPRMFSHVIINYGAGIPPLPRDNHVSDEDYRQIQQQIKDALDAAQAEASGILRGRVA